MAVIGEYKDTSRLEKARADLATMLHTLKGYVGADIVEAIERLIDAKISDAADRRY